MIYETSISTVKDTPEAADPFLTREAKFARRWLYSKGYDPVYGARPMARTIDENIKKPLVDEILFGRLEKGGKVNFDVKDGKLAFEINTKQVVRNQKVEVT